MMAESNSNAIVNKNQNCLSCRIISGCGLFGSGIYVFQHSKNITKKTGKTLMVAIASGLMMLGTARLLDLPPFKHISV